MMENRSYLDKKPLVRKWVSILQDTTVTSEMVNMLSIKIPFTMRRSESTLILFVMPLLLTGCTFYAYEGSMAYEDSVAHEVIHESPRREGVYYHHAEGDIRDYMTFLDLHLRLSRQQDRSRCLRRLSQRGRIHSLLTNRVYDLLEHTPSIDHPVVYPFPRDFSLTHSIARRWWVETDRQIESQLTPWQLRQYRALTHRG